MKLLNFSIAFLTTLAISQKSEGSTSNGGNSKTFSVSIIPEDPTQESSSQSTRPSPTTITKPTSENSEKPSVTSIPETSKVSKTEARTTATTTTKATTKTTTTTTSKEAPWTAPPPVATFGPNSAQTLIPSMMSMGLVYLGVTYLTGII